MATMFVILFFFSFPFNILEHARYLTLERREGTVAWSRTATKQGLTAGDKPTHLTSHFQEECCAYQEQQGRSEGPYWL